MYLILLTTSFSTKISINLPTTHTLPSKEKKKEKKRHIYIKIITNISTIYLKLTVDKSFFHLLNTQLKSAVLEYRHKSNFLVSDLHRLKPARTEASLELIVENKLLEKNT